MNERLVSAADLRALAGVDPNAMANAKVYAHTIVFDFGTVAVGNVGTSNAKIEAGQVFVVDEWSGWPVLGAAWGAAIAGSPLIAEGSPTVGSNTMVSAWPLTVDFQIGNRKLSLSPIDVPALVQPGQARSYPGMAPIFPAGSTVLANFYTAGISGPTSIRFKLHAHGRYIIL